MQNILQRQVGQHFPIGCMVRLAGQSKGGQLSERSVTTGTSVPSCCGVAKRQRKSTIIIIVNHNNSKKYKRLYSLHYRMFSHICLKGLPRSVLVLSWQTLPHSLQGFRQYNWTVISCRLVPEVFFVSLSTTHLFCSIVDSSLWEGWLSRNTVSWHMTQHHPTCASYT